MAAMASPMGPPIVPGYSLRVQLYSHSAHSLEDKPVRCFRVVTSPDVTIREFCQEASRIHEINYGHPLTIKKVQDDQEFDVTQDEVLGSLFMTMSTIRMVQASTNSTVRDSVPPTSALRFEPSTNPRKRAREGSVSATVSTSSWKPEKRQKVFDPDKPLPSREEEVPAHRSTSQQENSTPNSQESVILGNNTRPVRFPRIPETPEPSLCASPNFERTTADRHARKAAVLPQLHLSNSRAKSASYHIPRTTERNNSTSTDATSPQSAGSRRITPNGITPTPKRKSPPGGAYRAVNEDSIYDVASDEEPAIKPRRVSLKARNSPNGLPGFQWAKDRSANTTPNGYRSASREQATTPGELPLTPNSKEHVLKQRQQHDEAKNARVAAAEAARQRQRVAEEARLAEEDQAAKRARAEREEQERLDIEEFNQAEIQRKAKAEQMKAKMEQEEKDMNLAREAEEKRIAKIEQARRRNETLAAVAKAEEAKRREEARANAQAEKRNPTKSKSKSRELESPIPEAERASKSTSPILPKFRSASSTPFIPHGKPAPKKSCLKSSQAMKSSSPVRPSSSGSNSGEVMEAPIPFLSPRARTVSFDLATETPMRTPSTSILPPSRAKPALTPSNAPAVAPVKYEAKPLAKAATGLRRAAILPPARNTTAILSPSAAKRQSAERSASPVTTAPAPPPSSVKKRVEPSESPVVKTTPIPPPTRIIPGSRIVPGAKVPPPVKPVLAVPPKSTSPVEQHVINIKSKPAKQAQAPVGESSESEEEVEEEEAGESDDEEDEMSDVEMMTRASTAAQISPADLFERKDEEYDDEESDVEMNDAPAQVHTATAVSSKSEADGEAEAPSGDVEIKNAPSAQDPEPAPSKDTQLLEIIPLPDSDSESEDDDRMDILSKPVMQNPFLIDSPEAEQSEEEEPNAQNTPSHGAQEVEHAQESEDEDPDTTQSQNSTPPPDDRSPILYHQNTSRAMETKLKRIPMLDGSSGYAAVNRTIKLEPNSGDEEEPTPKAKPTSVSKPIELSETSSSSDEEEVQVPKSSQPSQRSVKPSPRPSPSFRQSSTQSQVNKQLSSSFGRQNSTPVPQPSSQARARPASQYKGLSALAGKNLVGNSQSKTGARPAVHGVRKGDDENSMSESEGHSSHSSSDSEEDQPEPSLPQLPVYPSTPQRKFKSKARDDSSADSNSDDSDDEAAEEERQRLEKLKIEIAGMQAGGSGYAKATVDGGRKSMGKKVVSASASKADKKREEKKAKERKYLSGYGFSQPLY